jgi:hypothetical protein
MMNTQSGRRAANWEGALVELTRRLNTDSVDNLTDRNGT